MSSIVPPSGMIASYDGRVSRPESCRNCFFHDVPRGGVPLPTSSPSPEVRADYQNRAYCRRGAPAPTEGASRKIAWPLVHLDRDWCGSGVAL
ncbi:hypothetical protein J8J14_23715 [Roseomonas sp. SSH11]|uniref:Uncharacterized protein n=1 Tax=Pararoseomonas baculiformis TaxID=2820812 RepID=A0ABS4ANF3_9PROT|nr:hypothetical protein [Pararoseomonas baculiformis]MBP0447759.1 hypothetical protein [Pararoseomonas baculiformis]